SIVTSEVLPVDLVRQIGHDRVRSAGHRSQLRPPHRIGVRLQLCDGWIGLLELRAEARDRVPGTAGQEHRDRSSYAQCSMFRVSGHASLRTLEQAQRIIDRGSVYAVARALRTRRKTSQATANSAPIGRMYPSPTTNE